MSSVLAGLRRPDAWRAIPFGRVTTRSTECERSDLQPLSVYLGIGVVPRSEREDNHNRLGADMTKYLVVRPGDLVFNKLRTWQGGFGVSKFDGVVSPAYFVCRPNGKADPRFLQYLLRSDPYLSELTRVSKFMPPSQFDILWDDLKLVEIRLPPESQQREIADYLDTETTRIDALITKKRKMIGLLNERLAAAVDQAIWSDANLWPSPAMSVVVTIAEGQVDPKEASFRDMLLVAPNHVESGSGEIIQHETAAEQGAISGKYLCRQGDVIYSKIRPNLRKACIAPGRCLTSADMYPMRTGPNILPEYLLYFLLSDRFTDFAVLESERVAMPKINRDALGRIRFPTPPIDEQKRIVEDLAYVAKCTRASRRMITQQIDLLVQRRQALITAAVTGELAIPGAAA